MLSYRSLRFDDIFLTIKFRNIVLVPRDRHIEMLPVRLLVIFLNIDLIQSKKLGLQNCTK